MEPTNKDVLQFYAFSQNKNAGEGVGDIVNSNPKIYSPLNEIVGWRRMFSSFWSGDPFVYNGKTYLSFEHAYQASKFRINGLHEEAEKFCLNSNHNISKLTGKAVQSAGRQLKLNKSQIDNWDNSMRKIKDEIYRAKFTIHTRPGQALLLTKNATLINAGPRIKKIHCTRLESLRNSLIKQVKPV